MVIEATCMDCGRTFRCTLIRAPKEPMKRCPECARKHYAGKYREKHRVDMLVKAMQKVQEYCAGQQHGRRKCAFWNTKEEECKLYGSCPIAWALDDDDDAATDTSGKGV